MIHLIIKPTQKFDSQKDDNTTLTFVLFYNKIEILNEE
jgi:hypothetical protein